MQHALKVLAVLPFACASAMASPDPATRPAPPAATCRPAGAVMFEIDHRVDPGAKLATSTVKVFASGAWTRDEIDADGKPAPQRTGCFANPDLKQLEATLRDASWKVTTSRIHCMALSPTFTVFLVRGKPVFTQRLCSGQVLDDKSRAKLEAATTQVEGEAGKSAP